MSARILPIRPRVLRRWLWSMMAGAVVAGTGIGYAAHSHADPGTDYAANNAARICTTLDAYPTLGGVMGVGQAIVNEGELSFRQAGEAIAVSVAVVCPNHQPLIDLFIATYAPQSGGYLA